MKRVRTWQLCRTGVFGADGARITEKDLKEIAETFAPPRPVTIGHDGAAGDRFPKFGDVLAIDGIFPDGSHPGEKTLVGKVVLHPALEKVFSGKGEGAPYSGWSVTIPRRAVDGKRYLHSLAVCGATPPKIPELEELMVEEKFSDGDAVESVAFDGDAAYQDEEEEEMTDEEKKKLEELEAKNAALEKELEEAKKKAEKSFSDDAEKAKIAQRLEETEKVLRENQIERFCDAVGKNLPAGLMGKARAIAEAIADAEAVKFSDNGEEKSEKPLSLLRDVLAEWPAVEGKRVYSFSDSGEDDEKNKGNKWADIAAKL